MTGTVPGVYGHNRFFSTTDKPFEANLLEVQSDWGQGKNTNWMFDSDKLNLLLATGTILLVIIALLTLMLLIIDINDDSSKNSTDLGLKDSGFKGKAEDQFQ